MTPWIADRMVTEVERDFRQAAEAHRRAAAARARRRPPHRPWPQQVSVWCGYRLIGVGARLVRPALVPGPPAPARAAG